MITTHMKSVTRCQIHPTGGSRTTQASDASLDGDTLSGVSEGMTGAARTTSGGALLLYPFVVPAACALETSSKGRLQWNSTMNHL
jgi:hypothetical protein